LEIPELEISRGLITAITGPNGSGKTTLLEILALLRKPASGEVFLWGQDTPAVCGCRNSGAIMVMHPGVLFSGSVRRNLTLGLKWMGYRYRDAKVVLEAAAGELLITDLLDRNVRSLSAGQRQRVNLARAIVLRRRRWALLLDEPLANVDTDSARIIRHALSDLKAEGATILMTSPSGVSLPEITDRTLRIHGLPNQSQHPCQVSYDDI
jgi:tungstate transport system ATP-binding protein